MASDSRTLEEEVLVRFDRLVKSGSLHWKESREVKVPGDPFDVRFYIPSAP
jgi:hypothetical protein